jgi:hypothetical protein
MYQYPTSTVNGASPLFSFHLPYEETCLHMKRSRNLNDAPSRKICIEFLHFYNLVIV